MASKRTNASTMALGGVTAALAVVIMSMGTLIPVATYVCPTICMLILKTVRVFCGSRNAWAWYGAVSILSLLLAPDKEAAAVFLCLGYYPIVKPKMDTLKGKWLWKGLLFNGSIITMYALLINLTGLSLTQEESKTAAAVLIALMLLLGNVTFFLLDRLLGMQLRRRNTRK